MVKPVFKGQVCNGNTNECVESCADHLKVNASCLCTHSGSQCQPDDICGNQGCLKTCEEGSILNDRCYCADDVACGMGEVCSGQSCYSSCPLMNTTITKECFCNPTKSICGPDNICNSLECSKPLDTCPSYPLLASEGGCFCGKKVCPEGQVCTEDQMCKPPAQCDDPTSIQEYNMKILTQAPQFTEGYDVTFACNDCYFFPESPDSLNMTFSCDSNGTWSKVINPCSLIQCTPIDFDEVKVIEVPNDETCQNQRTYSCKEEMDTFDFSQERKNNVSYTCTSRSESNNDFTLRRSFIFRGWKANLAESCSEFDTNLTQICKQPRKLSCNFQVLKPVTLSLQLMYRINNNIYNLYY